MLLIATDEAGYGPKLGPLVIVATAWQVPTPPETDWRDRIAAAGTITADPMFHCFRALRRTRRCDGLSIAVKDSKLLYKPGDGLGVLHAIVSASHHWCGRTESTWLQCLPHLAADDLESIRATPWYGCVSDSPLLVAETTRGVRAAWGRSGLRQLATRARVVTAARFNRAFQSGGNKADLLTEATLGLVRTLLAELPPTSEPVLIQCDRHGGRRYYAGILQHTFRGSIVRVVSEKPTRSVYRIDGEDGMQVDVHFMVGGDHFAPIAMSSIHAKYLRERLMESFNEYFRRHHQDGTPLKPTAGYTTDANRFLRQIEQTVSARGIAINDLVRSR